MVWSRSPSKSFIIFSLQCLLLSPNYPCNAFLFSSGAFRSSSPPAASLSSSTVGLGQFSDSVFKKLIQSAANIITSSDLSDNEIEHSYGSASQGQWICSKTAGEMQRDVLERLILKQVGVQHQIHFIDSYCF